MNKLRTALTFITLAAAAHAQTPKASNAAANRLWEQLKYAPLRSIALPHVEEFRLPDGMRVLLLESHDLPLIRGTAFVRTGNLFDPADKIGLATVTGDVLRSGGTATSTGDQIDEQLENIAASVESGIGESDGTVSFSCLKENTAEVMGVFKSVIAHPEFRQDKLDLIKQQMAGGITRRNDDPGDIAQREFDDTLYGRNNSYGWSMEISTVMNIQRADLQAFYKRYFFPANMILAVQGDFVTADMKAQLTALFADWTVTQPPVPPFPAVHFNYRPGTYLATKEDVTQTNFIMGQPGGELNDPDLAALEVMSNILGGGFNSRLFKRIRTQLGYVYGVNASWGVHYDHPGLFTINGSTKSSTTVQAIEAAQEEVKRIQQGPVTEDELDGAKETVLNSFVFAFDTPAKTISRLARYYYFHYPEDFIFQYQKAVKAVTREDVLRVAKKYIDVSKFVVLAVGNPKDFGTPLDKLGSKVTPLDLTIPMPPGMAGKPMGGGMR